LIAVLVAGSLQTLFATPDNAGMANRLKPMLSVFTGDLHGVFLPAQTHPLTWKLTLSPIQDGIHTGDLAVTGADFELRVALSYEPAAERFEWRTIHGRIDLASWMPVLVARPEVASLLAGISATGIMTIAGEGSLTDGIARGGLQLVLHEATLRNDTQEWSADGVTVRVGGDASGLLAGRVPVEITVRTLTTPRFGARNFTLGAVLKDFERLEVTSARIEIAGGEVMAEPFAMELASPAVDVTFVMKRVGLQDLVMFVPATLSEASGRIDGRLQLKWNATEGVQVGGGHLRLEKSEPTTLRLVSTPGFLTENVPARFTFLPPAWGPLARWFSAPNEAHAALSEIERGKVGLRVESLDVRLTPEGDERGRSASAIVRGRPEKPGGVIGEVTFEINVSGPLASVLRLGMEQTLSIQVR
jgi:hypothetical protein